MEEVLRQTLLYDFYGELLTEHQREVYEAVVQNDLSYSEAAEEFGVSRQGVHDLVKRSEKILEDYESKLHLVERFLKIRAKAEQILELSTHYEEIDAQSFAEQTASLSAQILEEL
ncbi:MAG: YlxM family DNA-binding protein [Lachnospiraceae bacterium]|nr:YlxM family DNA-binding protein [Lachnospiraceae bacterium]